MKTITKEMAMERNNGKAVYVGVPIYSSNYFPQFATAFFNALYSVKFYKYGNVNGDSLVTRARNNLAHKFLQTDATHLLFIDSDLEFNNQSLDMLYEHDKPIVCGVYPKKELKLQWVLSQSEEMRLVEGDLERVQEAGTGFMLIKREVFEAMRDATPELAYKCDSNKDIRHDFFRVGVFKEHEQQEHARYLSEDWYFCYMARQLGYHTWVDKRVTLSHHGNYVYPATKDELEEALEQWNLATVESEAKKMAALQAESNGDN
jgi:hypothetical protein